MTPRHGGIQGGVEPPALQGGLCPQMPKLYVAPRQRRHGFKAVSDTCAMIYVAMFRSYIAKLIEVLGYALTPRFRHLLTEV